MPGCQFGLWLSLLLFAIGLWLSGHLMFALAAMVPALCMPCIVRRPAKLPAPRQRR